MIVAVIIFCLPFGPASVPWFDEFDAPAFNYTPMVLVVGVARRDLVGGVREEQVHRARADARRGRGHARLTGGAETDRLHR